MSRTISSAICETNKALGLPQENVFFHSLYRLPGEYSSTFVRSAKSTSPIQIAAIFSAQGADNIAASSLQQVINAFSGIVKQTQSKAVIDYESFSTQVVSVLNNLVCNISIANSGTPLRLSCTMLVIEGDVLRILSIGNTRSYLLRKGKVISLTEDQTVAHRYVQLGAITRDAENTHPERNVLTQYLGRFPQDGPVVPEKKVHFKLQDNDEIMLFGVGIAQYLQPSVLGFISSKPTLPETKASEFVSAALQSGARGGISALVFKVESVLVIQPQVPVQPQSSQIIPATAAYSAVASSAVLSQNQQVSNSLPKSGNVAGVQRIPTDDLLSDKLSSEDDYMPNHKSSKLKKVLMELLISIGIFVCCFFIGYGAMFVVMNYGNWTENKNPTISGTVDLNESLNKVMYSFSDHISVFAEESLDSAILQELSRGEAVKLISSNNSFAKVVTNAGNTGYVMTAMLSDTDPTIGDPIPDMSVDPTPIPDYVKITPSPTPKPTTPTSEETDQTTESSTETTPSETSASETTESSETGPTPTPTLSPTLTPTPTIAPSETSAPTSAA
jgi:serine/threonine protein phosphatase PrpC